MTDDPTRIPDDSDLDDPVHAQIELTRQQLTVVTDNFQLLKLIESPIGAAFLLGTVRGRLNCMADVGLISHAQANELAEDIKTVYDKRFAGLADHAEAAVAEEVAKHGH
jgi:hypothetical protein